MLIYWNFLWSNRVEKIGNTEYNSKPFKVWTAKILSRRKYPSYGNKEMLLSLWCLLCWSIIKIQKSLNRIPRLDLHFNASDQLMGISTACHFSLHYIYHRQGKLVSGKKLKITVLFRQIFIQKWIFIIIHKLFLSRHLHFNQS